MTQYVFMISHYVLILINKKRTELKTYFLKKAKKSSTLFFSYANYALPESSILERLNWEKKANTLELIQNFPNPFNTVTHILVGTETERVIDLIVYDINGRLINYLAQNCFIEPGFHHFQWKTSGKYASGIYIVTLKSKKKIINNRIMHIK